MLIVVSSLAPEAREHYRVLGERVATPDAVAQANKTLRAFEHFGVQVSEHGYGVEDNARLFDAHETLLARHTDRSEAVDASKLAGVTYSVALRGAKHERQSARTLCNTCITPLLDEGRVQDATRLQTLIKQTAAAPDDNTLLDHIKRLQAMLADATLAPLFATRGGPSISTRLETARVTLLGATRDRAAHPDVSTASEERNIIEGIIVVNCRNAYAAARVAARRLGQPAIASEFKLVHFRSNTRSAPAGDEPPTGEPGTVEPAPSE